MQSTERHEYKEDLQRLADQIRLKVHLAGMDAKDVWSRLEPKLFSYERKAEKATDKVADDLARVAKELKRDLRRLLMSLTPT